MAANICMILYFALTLQSQNRNNLTGWFCRQELSCGVMVARRILVPPVRVRVLPRQQVINAYSLLRWIGVFMWLKC